MSSYRVIVVADSLGLAYTSTGDLGAGYDGLGPVWSRVEWSASAPGQRRLPWQAQVPSRGLSATPAPSPNLMGPEAALIKRINDLGHTAHVILVAKGSTTLGADWLSPSGSMYLRALAEYPLAVASTNCPADPGAAKTILVASLGTNDCLTSDAFTASATAQANAAALLAGWRAVVGAAMKCVWRLPCTDLPSPATGTRITNFRAGIAAMVAADSGKSVSYDPPTSGHQGDGIHDTDAGARTIGSGLADALLTL